MKNELNEINNKLFKIRGKWVMLDSDLAEFYKTNSSQLNRVRKRHSQSMTDKCFQLTLKEWQEHLRQTGTTSNRPLSSLPWVYTERGAYRLATLLKSERAEMISDVILDAFLFVKNRLIGEDSELASKRELKSLEVRVLTIEEQMKGEKLSITNTYFGDVTINNNTVNNDIELMFKLQELQKTLDDKKDEKKLESIITQTIENARNKDTEGLSKNLTLLNKSLDSVDKASKAGIVMGKVIYLLKEFLGV